MGGIVDLVVLLVIFPPLGPSLTSKTESLSNEVFLLNRTSIWQEQIMGAKKLQVPPRKKITRKIRLKPQSRRGKSNHQRKKRKVWPSKWTRAKSNQTINMWRRKHLEMAKLLRPHKYPKTPHERQRPKNSHRPRNKSLKRTSEISYDKLSYKLKK